MKSKTGFIVVMFFYLLTIMGAGRVLFLYYNRAECLFTLRDVLKVELLGLPIDIVLTAMLMLFPCLVMCLSTLWKKMPLRPILAPYFAVAMLVLVCVIGGDAIMYEHWKFKLDASIFSYMSEPGSAGASVSVLYILVRIGTAVVAYLLTTTIAILLVPKKGSKGSKGLKSLKGSSGSKVFVFVIVFVIVSAIPSVYPLETIPFAHASAEEGVGEKSLFLSHAAVNPVYHMAASLWLYSKPSEQQFVYMSDKEATQITEKLFPSQTEDITDTLLTTTRPNILTIQLESFGAVFIERLGGIEGVAPELSAWMDKSVNFTNAYATSFRTDRGTVSVLAGMPSYPTQSLMLVDSILPSLPAFARTLQGAGYQSSYIYGGNPKLMNKEKYLLSAGFQKVYGIEDLEVESKERDSWGANDSISLHRTLRILSSLHKANSPFYLGYQTISSHMPFDVPYHRLEDKVLNGFAYTDHCVGMFLDSLSRTPIWDNLLVVVFADHGYPYHQDFSNPEFFHMPLFMTGGAVRQPRTVETLIAQNDVVATILSQMHISHRQFRWSRNVFSAEYKHPCVYATYPAGLLYRDTESTIMTDLHSGCIVHSEGADAKSHQRTLNAILQSTYRNGGYSK